MNIDDYEFYDVDVKVERHESDVSIGFKIEYKCHVTKLNEYAYMYLNKVDVIALAKHFKLTSEDIKD